MSGSTVDPVQSRRRALKVAISALCSEVGFSHAEDPALETLTEMMQSSLSLFTPGRIVVHDVSELGRSSRAFTELAGRTEPMISDVVMALVEMGADVQSLPAYAKRQNKMVLMPPSHSTPTPTPRTLQAGQKKTHPAYIPDYLPAFPDPHAYIKTQTHKKPVTEYQIIREKASSQKRDVERALTRFIAKTGDTENLFPDDPYAYPLISCKPKQLPYLEALLPKDYDLESQDEHEQSMKQQRKQQEQQQKSQKDASKDAESVAQQENSSEGKPGTVPEGNNQNDNTDTDGQIDNPYLRPIKMPKLKGVTKKSKVH